MFWGQSRVESRVECTVVVVVACTSSGFLDRRHARQNEPSMEIREPKIRILRPLWHADSDGDFAVFGGHHRMGVKVERFLKVRGRKR